MSNVKEKTITKQTSAKEKRESERNKADTRLPQSHAGGQGPYLRSLDHFGRSSEAIDHKNPKKVKCDGPTDGRTDGRTDKAGCRVA